MREYYWWLPDLFEPEVLVVAGPTIGGCRTFLMLAKGDCGRERPKTRECLSSYKAYYKEYLYQQRSARAAARLLVRKFGARGEERPGGAGRAILQPRHFLIHSGEKETGGKISAAARGEQAAAAGQAGDHSSLPGLRPSIQ